MRIQSALAAAVAAGCLVVAAQAADPVRVDGTLVGAPLPATWRIYGAALAGNNGKIYIRVEAEGNCHTEWREECQTYPDGHVVCRPQPVWVCDQAYSLFLMPPSIRIDGKNVLYGAATGDLKIGEVRSFLFWKWIALRDGARIQPGYLQSSLILDTDRLNGRKGEERGDTFVRLHGEEKTIDMLVGFKGVTNHGARELIRGAGYGGEFAAANDWTAADPAKGQIGIRVTPSEGSAILSRLQANRLVTGIRPFVAAN